MPGALTAIASRARVPLLAGLLLITVRLAAQQQPSQQSATAPPRFGVRTEAVLVDVSVTDRRGRPITDLNENEFQIFEDGVLQKMLTFARHQPDPRATAADAARSAGLMTGAAMPGGQREAGPTSRGPTVVALAFDRLSPEGRVLAVKAARAFLDDKQADELAGVFIVDQALATVSPYTTDKSKLTTAIDRVSTTATTQMARDQRNPVLDAYYASPDVPWVAGAEEKGRAAGQVPWADPIAQAEQSGDHAQVQILQALMRMDRSYKDMLYEMQGQASINSLLALVDSLGGIEGRKAVIYFCEGLTIPPSVEPKYRAIIDNANRNNVTVYTLDAAGLRVQSKQAETAMGMNELGAMGVGDVRRGDKYLEGLEDNERYLKLDPAVSLGILASQTGGLLIDNTNDLARGIRKIDDDRRNYYLLSYSPTNPSQDGAYRKLTVLVNRPDVEVRARSGYRAIPKSDTGPTISYETAALAALAADPAPADFPVDIGAYSVPMPGRPGLSAVLANIPGSSLSFLKNDAGHAFSGEVVVYARLGGVTGELPRKLSQQYVLEGDLDKLAGTRSRRILFFRTADLLPGEHDVEVAVHDGAAKRNQVFRTSLHIPPPSRPVVGDLMLVDHAEKLENGEAIVGNPLVANQLALVPTYRPTLSRQERTEVNFAVSLLLEPGAPLPFAKLTLNDAGAPLSSIALPLHPPDPDGRLLAVGRIPIASIPAGHYELELTIGSGASAQTRRAELTLTDTSTGASRMDITRLKDFGARYAQAWCSHDPDQVAAFFAPDGSLTINAGTPSVGRAAIAAAANAFMTSFPDMVVTMNDVTLAGPQAVFQWTLSGTNTGPGGTGRTVRISGYEEWTIGADGLIARSLGHFDEIDYQRQLKAGAGSR